MSFYLIVVYLHIMGAAGLFLGLGMEGILLKNIGNASTTDELLKWRGTLNLLRIDFASTTILLILSGLYLVFNLWGWTAWVITGLVLLIILSGTGSKTGKKIGGILMSLKDNESLPAAKEKLSIPDLIKFFKIKITTAAGIIFIMTLKTDWIGSIIVIVVSILAGLLISSFSKK